MYLLTFVGGAWELLDIALDFVWIWADSGSPDDMS